jgi:hypothetical protein
VAADAHVTIAVGGDPTDPHAQGILLTSVEVV